MGKRFELPKKVIKHDSPITADDFDCVEKVVLKLCDSILTKGDEINKEEFFNYLNQEKVDVLNKNYENLKPKIDLIVTKKVTDYIQEFEPQLSDIKQQIKDPFEFVGGGEYIKFCSEIERLFIDKYKQDIPYALHFALDSVRDVSKTYRVFKSFYDVRSKQTANKVIKDMETSAKKIVDEGVNEKVEKFLEIIDDKTDEVDEKIKEVPKKVSENGVTILGIFSGITLAMVGGMFYSAKVLENIASTNALKLICISSIIGFVCLNLFLMMFYFISKLSGKEIKMYSDRRVLMTNGTLLFAIIITICLLMKYPQYL